MSSIAPCLWCDNVAEEAVAFYTAAFPNVVVNNTNCYPAEGWAEFQQNLAGEVLTIDFDPSVNPDARRDRIRIFAVVAGRPISINHEAVQGKSRAKAPSHLPDGDTFESVP